MRIKRGWSAKSDIFFPPCSKRSFLPRCEDNEPPTTLSPSGGFSGTGTSNRTASTLPTHPSVSSIGDRRRGNDGREHEMEYGDVRDWFLSIGCLPLHGMQGGVFEAFRGCSWGLSAIGAIEGISKFKFVTGSLISLLEQKLMDCNKGSIGSRDGKGSGLQFLVNFCMGDLIRKMDYFVIFAYISFYVFIRLYFRSVPDLEASRLSVDSVQTDSASPPLHPTTAQPSLPIISQSKTLASPPIASSSQSETSRIDSTGF
ncbi:hypothetical protein ACLB2K_002211 [Fragaria x ananassa]